MAAGTSAGDLAILTRCLGVFDGFGGCWDVIDGASGEVLSGFWVLCVLGWLSIFGVFLPLTKVSLLLLFGVAAMFQCFRVLLRVG